LRLDVLLDNLIRHIARARGEIASCPQMPPPELAVQLTELLQHLPAAAPLDPLHQSTHRDHRRHRYQQVHVIHCNVPTHDVHIQRRTGLTNQLTQSNGYLAAQDWLSIFGDPHHMVLQVIDGMRCLPIAHRPIVPSPTLLSTRPGRAGRHLLLSPPACPPRPGAQCGVENGLPKGRGFYPIYRQ
jgi:hypothetical protein